MKKLLLTLLAVGITGACADIQAPPASHQTSIHKLGRGVSNLLYGITELPNRIVRVNAEDGNNAGFGSGIIEGTQRSLVRVGYGIFEILTFPAKTYKQSYKAPYQNIEYDPYNGYSEYGSEIGFQSKFGYGRKQSF
ncbi:MAG: putative exosortase-associated protein (TIGR04073 family) [Verrucomicrobiales bacterium]|jgi:putative exosortase-associated protein (TIGR04073 family)